MKRKNKFLKPVLALGVSFASLAGISLFNNASATMLKAGVSHDHCVCGDDSFNHTHVSQSWTAWTDDDSLPTSSGYYYLDNDVKIASTWNVTADISLCLNGHLIQMDVLPISQLSAINVASGVKFTLTDCKANDYYSYHYFNYDDGSDTKDCTLIVSPTQDEKWASKAFSAANLADGDIACVGGGAIIGGVGCNSGG